MTLPNRNRRFRARLMAVENGFAQQNQQQAAVPVAEGGLEAGQAQEPVPMQIEEHKEPEENNQGENNNQGPRQPGPN